MITIYHNPRCRKSRETLAILNESDQEIEIVEYLKDVPSIGKLKEILGMLDIPPMQLVRRNEAVWKENFRGKDLSDAEVIQAMHDYPKLIERPVVIRDGTAVIGRPPESVKEIL